jgi:hypothetical protein
VTGFTPDQAMMAIEETKEPVQEVPTVGEPDSSEAVAMRYQHDAVITVPSTLLAPLTAIAVHPVGVAWVTLEAVLTTQTSKSPRSTPAGKAIEQEVPAALSCETGVPRMAIL